MANTYVDYTATAAQTDFAFTFPYLEDEHVVVEIDGSATTAFSIVTTPSTKIVLDSGATAGQKVRVRRKSQPDTDLVDFENGSVLTESELDRAYQHNRFLNEEISELNDASLQKAVGSDDWDAKSQKLTNLADPTEAQDAATKNYVDTQDALQVTKTGDSMSGALAMGSNKITGLGTPTLTDDAATKTYVDAKVNQVSSGASSPPTKWVFTGTAGANTTYSVTGAEVNGDTAYDVSVDGSVLEPTTDYTVDPDTDTLTIVNTLSGGEDIVVIERGFGIAVSDGVVGEDQLQTNSVSTAKIQNDAVTTAKLADHSVTAVKISNTDPVFNVQTTGEVGIGTTNPSAPLHVLTSGTDGTLVIESDDAGSDYAPDFLLFRSSTTPAVNDNLGEIKFRGKNDDDPQGNIDYTMIRSRIKDPTNNSEKGELTFWTRSGTTLYQRMTIDPDGNVGIGTETPDGLLELYKASGSDGYNHLRLITGGGGGLSIGALSDDANPTWAINTNSDEPLVFSSATNEYMRIDSGNVGIGTASPSAPLEVSSTTGGVVFPRLTTTQRNAITSPTDGETIFNTTTNQVESYNGSSWGAMGSGVSKATRAWTQLSSSADGTNFTFTHNLGTSDVIVQIYVNSSASDTGALSLDSAHEDDGGFIPGQGAVVTSIQSSNAITVQLGTNGYYSWNNSGVMSNTTFNSKYIKVVVIG